MSTFGCKSCDPFSHKDWSFHVNNPTLKCWRCPCRPLNDAIRNNAPEAVIFTLLVTYADAAKMPDRDGYLPLHKAVELKRSNAIILALLNAHKQAAVISTGVGDLPLHLAIKHSCSSTVIRALFAENTYTAKVADCNGELPLHLAINKVQHFNRGDTCYSSGK